MKLNELIVLSANKGLELQNENGSFPKGNNGPWHDKDTYVRTTAHWAILENYAFKLTGNEEFETCALKACDYLLIEECRPQGYSFFCRENKRKDKCNGLIGQAWALEALIEIGGVDPNRRKYLDYAVEAIGCFTYDYRKHMWKTTEVNGKKGLKCRTLNQQIWFSVMVLIAGELTNNRDLIEVALDYFDNMSIHIKTAESGLIGHFNKQNKMIEILYNSRKVLYERIFKRRHFDNFEMTLSIGYLSFILYGLSILYARSSSYEFWQTDKMKGLIQNAYNYVEKNKPYFCGDDGNNYVWGYNPVGIEIAYTIQSFGTYLGSNIYEDSIQYWLVLQMQNYYDLEEGMMSKNTIDEIILAARFYEAARLKNIDIDFSN